MNNSSKAGTIVVLLLVATSAILKIQTCKHRQKQHQQFNSFSAQDRTMQEAMLSQFADHCANPSNAPERKNIDWVQPDDSLTNAEKTRTGTWAAKTGDLSLSTGGVMISLGDTAMATAHTKVAKMLDDIEKSKHLKSGCIWLELYDDHTGFWNGCMLVNESPNALDNVNPITGKHEGFGVKFDWKFDKNTLHISFEDCLKYPMVVGDSSVITVRVKYWDLMITKTKRNSDGGNILTIRDYFPEYNYKSPITYEYETYSGTLSGKITEYKSAIME
ncbi:MAG: hypothetical protein ACHQF2_09095 [Flavobacteriales bacterium]